MSTRDVSKFLRIVARTCTLILMVLDVLKPLQHKKLLENELEGFGIRLNKSPPNITLRRKEKGGLNIQTLVSFPHSILLKMTFAGPSI